LLTDDQLATARDLMFEGVVGERARLLRLEQWYSISQAALNA